MIPSHSQYHKKYGIYCFTNKINGKKYIGKSISIYDRYINHRRGKHGQIFKNAIKKYGWENFEFEILEEYDNERSEEFLLDREEHWILYYKATDRNFGYNLVQRFSGGKRQPLSEETKQKMRDWHKNNKQPRRRGKDHYMFGKKISEERRGIISKTNKGRIPPSRKPIIAFNGIETKEYLCFHHASEAVSSHRKTIRMSIKNKTPYKGFYWILKENFNEETIKNYDLSIVKNELKHMKNKRAVIIYNDKEKREFICSIDAAKYLGCHKSYIVTVISEKGKFKGYSIEYKDKKEKRSKVPILIFNEEIEQYFPSMKAAARFAGGNLAGIFRVVGSNKPYKGYHWAYKLETKDNQLIPEMDINIQPEININAQLESAPPATI